MKIRHAVMTLGMLAGTAGFAQSPGYGPPPRTPEAAVDARQTWNDRQDLERLRGMQVRMQRARVYRDYRTLGDIDRELDQFMREEWAEGRFKVMRARQEVHQDFREHHQDQQRAQDDRAFYGRPAGHDRRELRQDRRETRDDIGDMRAQEANIRRVQEISRDLQPLYGRYDPGAISSKRRLLDDLIRLTQWQLDQDHREQREGWKERRQDGWRR